MNNSEYILQDRYVHRDADGEPLETSDGIFRRVADFLSESNEEEMEYYTLMKNKDMLPNSPTLVNAGIEDGGCLSACFVVSPKDNTQSIFETLNQAAHIVKAGGGVGFGFSMLRHKGDAIKTVHKKALGPIAVMEIYSLALNKLTQGGSFREAALMGQLHVSHPDIIEFIHCKDDKKSLNNFNISVQISDDFMKAVQDNSEWPLISPRTGRIVKIVDASWLWNEIIESAHHSGDPGLFFDDRVQETHPNINLGRINGTNPCGEQPLEDFGSCNLASINLGNFVDHTGHWNLNKLKSAVHTTVNMLNRVIDKNTFPLQELYDMNALTRRIGLGVMGFADALVLRGIQYDSVEGLREANEIASFISQEAWRASENLAKGFGPFPNYYQSRLKSRIPTRNSCVTSIAPTGSISRIAECSSGIEPFFDLVWKSNILWSGDESVQMYDCPRFVYLTAERFFEYNEETVNKFLESLYNSNNKKELLRGIGINDETLCLFRTSHNIIPEWHVKMQAAWQSNISNGISKTINMPHDSTIEDVSAAYFLAWEEGCKGITIYRSGTRDIEVLTTKKESGIIEPLDIKVIENNIYPYNRPIVLKGTTEKVSTGHGNLYVTMNYDEDGNIMEVISNMGKAGACSNASLEAISRVISIALQYQVPMDEIVKQLTGITCCPNWSDGQQIRSPYDGLAKALSEIDKSESDKQISYDGLVKALSEIDKSESDKQIPYYEDNWMPQREDSGGDICPECQTYNLHDISGCPTCLKCSYSKCG